MSAVVALLWLSGVIPTLAADYNHTMQIEVDVWSSMITFAMWETSWSYNESSGGMDKARPSETATVIWNFVGVGYTATGDVRRASGDNSAGPTWSPVTGTTLVEQALGGSDVRVSKSTETTNTSHELGSMNSLDLSLHSVIMSVTPDALSANLRSVSFQIPVKSQASKLEDMQSGYASVRSPGMAREQVNSGFEIREFQSPEIFQMQNLSVPVPDSPKPNISYVAKNHSIDMDAGTEVAYKVPKNTSLLRLLHDVGPTGPFGPCYIALKPLPSWWAQNSTRAPWAQGDKPQNRANQTMFLLPLDPVVEYELAVGPELNDVQCNFGGVVSYSFFANGYVPTNETDVEDVTTSALPGATEQASAEGSSPSNGVNVGAIVGGVIGGVGGVVLLLLAAWLLLRFRRHRQHKQMFDFDDKPGEGPQVITPYTLHPSTISSPSTGKGALDASETFSPSTDSSSGPSGPSREPPSYPASAHPPVQYAQDAEDVAAQPEPTILPPRYNEAWGQRLMRNAPRRVNRMLKAERPMSPIRAHDAMKKP